MRKVVIIRLGDITNISRIHRTAQALQESNNYDVTVLCVEPQTNIVHRKYNYEVVYIPIKTRVIQGKLFLFLRVIEGIIRVVRAAVKKKYDIYMPIGFEDLMISFIILSFIEAKLVYNANELEGDRKRFKYKLLNKSYNGLVRRIEAFILRGANAVIAADFERAKLMKKWYKIKRVEFIRNVPLYHTTSNKNLIREKLSLSMDTKIILYQGGIGPGRGLEDSIKAVSRIKNKNFVFILLGNITHSYKSFLNRLAEHHDFKRLLFIDPIPWDQLLSWTEGADLSLVIIQNHSLSYFTAAPNKLYESIMAEIPYVASNFPEIKNVHEIAKAGILVNPSDINDISNAITKIISDKSFSLECIYNAKKAKEIFSWEKERKKLLNIIGRC